MVDFSNPVKKMPDELRRKVELLNPMQKKYCEYRAKGLKQYEAAEKAGSKATTKEAMGRVGYNIEMKDGAKEYIEWLIALRAEQACVDEVEIIEKLRRVYDEAIDNGKYAEANKAAQLLGDMIGAFDTKGANLAGAAGTKDKSTKNNVGAFKDVDDSPEDRVKKLSTLIRKIDSP